MVVITLAFMQDLVIYIYYLRKYLRFSERCKLPNNSFGGLEEASLDIPTTFRHIILVILFTSAFVNCFLTLDKVWYKDYSIEHISKITWVLILPFLIVFMLPYVQNKYYDYYVQLKRGRA